MFEMIKLNLQFHADAGTVVNGTSAYINSYTGATDTTGHTLGIDIKTFYDTELLENSRIEQKFAQFAKKVPLPEGNGHTIEFRKWNTFEKAGQLQEGVIPSGQKFGMTHLTAEVSQYGTYTSVTDRLELEAYDDIIGGATEEMGASASETTENLIRNALLANSNNMYCDNITLSTGDVTGTTPTQCSEMHSSSTVRAMLTPAMIARAVTKLKKDRVPTINGDYVAVIHPSVAEDLRNNKDWLNAHVYAQPEEIYNGEIGKLHGVRFIEDTYALILGSDTHTDYQSADGGVTYPTYFFGKDGFGIVDPAGGNLEMIVHDKDEIGGPLNQFSTIGYKMSMGVALLYTERVLAVWSCSSYSGTDEENY